MLTHKIKENIAAGNVNPTWISIALAILFWLFDSVIDVFVFNEGAFISQTFAPSLYELWTRLLICSTMILAVHSAFNIIRRKKIEEHLRSSEEKYRSVVESINIGISVISPKMEILSLNGQMTKWFPDIDISKKPVCYKTFNSPPREDLCSYCPTSKTLTDGQTHESITDTPVGDEIRHYRVISSPIKNAEGEVTAAIEMVEDITESKKADEVIKEQALQWQTTFDSMQDGVFLADTKGTVLRCNKAFTNILNKQESEIIGRTCHEIMHGTATFTKGCPFIAAMKSRNRETTELKSLDKWFSVTVDLIMNDSGDIVNFVHVISDITGRKQAETALIENEERYRNLFENAHDMIQIITPDGKFIFVNPAWLETTGYTWEEVRSLNVFDIVHADCKATCMETFKRVMSGEDVHDVEATFVAKDGKKIDVEGNVSVQIVEGKVVASYGIFRDVTEHRKIEERLFQITHDWEDTFDTITDMITVHDKDFNIVHANKAAEKLLGLPVLNASPRKCYQYYHGTGHPPEGCPSCDCLKTGLYSKSELYEPHLKMFIEIRAIPRFDSNNNLVGLIHVVRDISEQKKLEEQLRQSQKMEAVGELAGGIAHDFNNLLTAIIGYANILKMKMAKDDPLKDNLSHILTCTERGAHLTQSLLAFSRQQVSNPEPVRINEIIKNIEGLLSSAISGNIELKTILRENPAIMADRMQIDQVLINLATNARDAMPDGGALMIGTGQIELDIEFTKACGYGEPGTYAVISVSDTGTGMDEHIKGKIFEPFFTTKEVGKGTGLGLSIVYGIIKQHKGYITCYSEKGKGTTFKIYLPAVELEVKVTGPEKAIEPANKTSTILLAEDESAVRKLTKNILEEYGYTVIEAVDGEDAVNKYIVHRDEINMLMFDIIMPGMSGKEAYDKIKVLDPGIKVLLTSGYPSDFIHQQRIIEQGINFSSKPISPKGLMRKVQEVLAR